MRIKMLELGSSDLGELRAFYETVLGLPAELEEGRLRVRAGWTELRFRPAAAGSTPLYHFAFNIPENQFNSALEWTARRTAILADRAGETRFPSASWNSDSFYFEDAAGNILEFIARHELKNAAAGEFGADQILCVSEIGLGVEDVPALVDLFQEKLGLSPFKGERGETFTAVGDDGGLLIVVQRYGCGVCAAAGQGGAGGGREELHRSGYAVFDFVDAR
jgi:catechol-2,3-dioxygenase